MTPISYDLIAIGAGSAGLGATGIAHHLGLKTLMIDKQDFFIGGDCLNFGCVPSKALIHIARQFQAGREAAAFGLRADGKADLAKMMAHIHAQQDVIREHENADYFRAKGRDVKLGTARFVNRNTIEVDGERFTAPKIILCTGTVARRLEVEGCDLVADKLFDNKSLFWKLNTLPERFLVVGGGPVGCEMAQAFQRLGSRVTIVHHGERLLPKELPEFSRILEERFVREGIVIHKQAEVQAFSDRETALVKQENGETFSIHFDAALIAIGREVTTEGLALDQGGVEVKDGKIVVDDYYRTTNPGVYAIGDAAGWEMFSHGAEKHNYDLAFNFASPIKRRHDLRHFSWVTFTEPEVATFGYNEDQLKEKSIPYERIDQPFDDDDRAIVGDYRYSRLVLYFSRPHRLTRRVRILGGSMIAPQAGELIQELLLANQEGISTGAFFKKIYPYPVMSRINQKAIRKKRREGMSPLLKRVLRWLYRR